MLFSKTVGKGKDIVILHGWGCTHEHMQPIYETLKERYSVHLIDLPGMGKSPWDDSIRCIDDFVDRLLPVLPPKAIYVAFSLSGPIVFSIAARFPERVSQIVGIGTTPRFLEDTGWPGVPKPGLIAAFPQKQGYEAKDFFRELVENEFSTFTKKPSAYEELQTFFRNHPPATAPFLQGLAIADSLDLRGSFSKITCPLDLILGEKDACTPVETDPYIRKLNKKATIHRVPEAQHMLFWTHPREFFEVFNRVLH